jgi:hypothetical protein
MEVRQHEPAVSLHPARRALAPADGKRTHELVVTPTPRLEALGLADERRHAGGPHAARRRDAAGFGQAQHLLAREADGARHRSPLGQGQERNAPGRDIGARGRTGIGALRNTGRLRSPAPRASGALAAGARHDRSLNP